MDLAPVLCTAHRAVLPLQNVRGAPGKRDVKAVPVLGTSPRTTVAARWGNEVLARPAAPCQHHP